MLDNIVLKKSIKEKLVQLIAGDIDRSHVAEWAFDIINNDHIHVSDPVTWEIVQGLGAADLPTTDHDYLYGIDDFRDWLDKLE